MIPSKGFLCSALILGMTSLQPSWAAPSEEKAAPSVKPAAPLKALSVYPTQVLLDGPRDEQQLGVLGEYVDGTRRDLTREATFASTNSKIATVDASGIARPVGDGQAEITLQAGGKSVTISVKVQRAAADDLVSFSREVQPILTKSGCNGGACHGAQHGKGGFKLSLFGFDPFFDHNQIVQSAEGRRIVLSDPERSIFLMKPSLTMEHGGGERVKAGSRAYNIMRGWLEDGTPLPNQKDPQVTKMEVWPAKRVMTPGEQQQIIVRATWSDGRCEDVTPTAQYSSLNDAIALITPAGLITAKDKGETHIMVRFGGQADVVQVTLPYSPLTPAPLPQGERGYNFIDRHLIAKWQGLGLTPSPLCGDEEFLRRIHLDTIGTLPAPADIKAFLADGSKDKRAKAIDKVLNRPEFVDYWALKWGDLLRINRAVLQDKGMWSFHNWVRASLRENKPIDEFTRDIITAEGSTFTDGPANYFRIAQNPQDWAETTSQVFLGVRMQCAKCHHHPWEKWSQDDYAGLAAFFARLSTKGSQEFGIFGGESVVHLRPTGEVTHPRKGYVVPPHPLDGPTMEDPFDRRRKLADWITAKDNPFFAKNIVNRFWGYYMGRGLVEPLDDIRATNPASNPELLDALAKDFIDHKYEFKHLLRTIMNARAYQLSAMVEPGNKADSQNIHHTRYTLKRLTAEQMADALDFATGTREKYQGLPEGTRAIQLPDTRVRSFLMDVFGRPPRQVTCECERTSQPNIAQAMHLLNGDFLNAKLSSPTGRLANLQKNKTPLPQVVEELYLVTLSRPPRGEETKKALDGVAEAPTEKEGLEDLLWVLLNSREFLFNH